MLESLSFECDALKQQQNVQLDKQKEQLTRAHGQEVNDLKYKLENLKAEVDKTRLSEKQLRHKVDHQKEIIAAKTEELHTMSERVHETMSSEMLNLQMELTELESVKASVEEKLNELQYSKEQLELINSNLRNQLERLQAEKEEREKEVVSYCNALEKAREANQELQVQLDHVVQQSLDPASKGNSLFAEVEDRRAEMERQLISCVLSTALQMGQTCLSMTTLQLTPAVGSAFIHTAGRTRTSPCACKVCAAMQPTPQQLRSHQLAREGKLGQEGRCQSS
ncbi:protein Spindly-like [Lagopus muta]|uniref:protein Spindly-like n=1 Tax=Lagopus muta TaxID=64668 RepID=UPI00209D0362|nr:protein Spindly-like [Lagopus muta]